MKKWMIIIGSIAVIAVVGIFIVAPRIAGNQLDALLADLQTEEASRGSLQAYVGGTGVVRANQTASLFWETSGTVGSVSVQMGDLVEEGDVLAELSQTSLAQSIILAQADLVNAQNALETLYDGFDELAVANALQAITNADINLDNVQRTFNNLSSVASQAYIDQAEANLILAENQLERAQDSYNELAPSANELIRATRQSNMADAQMQYDAALRNYNAVTGTASPLNLANAEADLEVAQAMLTRYQTNYEELLSGPTNDDIGAAQARVTAALATLDMALITAPFGGTVTMAEPMPGDVVNAGTMAFRLDDVERLYVDVSISEVDINRIEIGQQVTMTFDAILAREYQGEVVEVALIGVPTQGVVSFNVIVELTDFDDQVRSGMTAAVNIIVSQLEDVLLVPNRAVRVLEGERVVYILNGDQIEAVIISLGSSSDYYSEVLNGELEEGDIIVLNPPSSFQQGPPMGGGFGGH